MSGNTISTTTSVKSGLGTVTNDIKKLTGIDMSKWFPTPGPGTKTPSTPSALKLKCQIGFKLGLNLPSIPSIYLPKFPPKLPSIPIPTSLPVGPCTISLDLACLGIPSDLTQVVIKYIIIPAAGGIIPPKTEALIGVVAGKVGSVIEAAEETQERLNEIKNILNNLSLDAMFGLDAIPCPNGVQKAKEKAAADAVAAKARVESQTQTREDIYNKYSDAIIEYVKNVNKAGVSAVVVYSYIISTRAVSYKIINKEAYANLEEPKKTQLENQRIELEKIL